MNCILDHHHIISLPFSGHYFIAQESPMTITKDDVYTAHRGGDYIPDWTFNSSKDFRIKFEYQTI